MDIKDKITHIKMIRTFIKYGFKYNKVEDGWYVEWDEFFGVNNTFIIYLPPDTETYGIITSISPYNGVEKKSISKLKTYAYYISLEEFIIRSFDNYGYNYKS